MCRRERKDDNMVASGVVFHKREVEKKSHFMLFLFISLHILKGKEESGVVLAGRVQLAD